MGTPPCHSARGRSSLQSEHSTRVGTAGAPDGDSAKEPGLRADEEKTGTSPSHGHSTQNRHLLTVSRAGTSLILLSLNPQNLTHGNHAKSIYCLSEQTTK